MTLTNAIITAYCAGTICANGCAPREGLTVAGPRWVPLGTYVAIAGRRYRVDDRTHRRYDGRWDVYMRSRTRCLAFGKQRMDVTIFPRVAIGHVEATGVRSTRGNAIPPRRTLSRHVVGDKRKTKQ